MLIEAYRNCIIESSVDVLVVFQSVHLLKSFSGICDHKLS